MSTQDLSPVDAAIADAVAANDGDEAFHYYRPLAALQPAPDGRYVTAYKYAGIVGKGNITWFRKYCNEVNDPKYGKGLMITDTYVGDKFLAIAPEEKELFVPATGKGKKLPHTISLVGVVNSAVDAARRYVGGK